MRLKILREVFFFERVMHEKLHSSREEYEIVWISCRPNLSFRHPLCSLIRKIQYFCHTWRIIFYNKDLKFTLFPTYNYFLLFMAVAEQSIVKCILFTVVDKAFKTQTLLDGAVKIMWISFICCEIVCFVIRVKK